MTGPAPIIRRCARCGRRRYADELVEVREGDTKVWTERYFCRPSVSDCAPTAAIEQRGRRPRITA